MSIGITDKLGRVKTLMCYCTFLSIGHLLLQITNTSYVMLMAILLSILKFCAMAVFVAL